MKDIKVLRQRVADLKTEGRAKLTKIEELEKIQTPSDEQSTQLAALTAETDALATKTEAAVAELEAAESRLARARLFQPSDAARHAGSLRSTEPDPAQTHGFHSMAEFGRAVYHSSRPGGQIDQRLLQRPGAAPTNYHETGGTSGEGFLVPPAMRAEIVEVMTDDQSAIMNMVDGEPTGSNAVQMLRDESTPWGASGVQAAYRAEGVRMDASKMATNGVTVHLHELYAFVLATDELLEDAPRLQARLTGKSAQAINWKGSDTYVWGTGAGQPLGWMESGAKVTVSKESGQAADTVVAENTAKMLARLPGGSFARALWLINSEVLPSIMTMKIGDQPIWTPPSAGFQQAPGGFLHGRPILPSEHCAAIGDVGDIQLVDPMGYYGPRKNSGIQFAQSMHLFFDYGMQAFRWTFRHGGQPFFSAPISPKRGAATKSHFIVLEAR